MKIDLSKVVWTAVISAVAGVGALVSAYFGASDWVLGLGFVSVTSALLSSREQ